MSDTDSRTARRWQTVAAGWEKHADAMRRDTMPVIGWMVDAIAPQPGTPCSTSRRGSATPASSPPS